MMAAGMSSTDIRSFLRHTACKKTALVVAADELVTHRVLAPGQTIIANTDISSGEGVHWVLFYVGKNKEINYFDPLGECSVEYPKFKKFISLYDKLTTNQGFPVQHDSTNKFSNTCAMHCLFVAHLFCDYRKRFLSLRDVMQVYKDPHSEEDITDNECMVLYYLSKKFTKYSPIFKKLTGCG
jgi:hypothetical protein